MCSLLLELASERQIIDYHARTPSQIFLDRNCTVVQSSYPRVKLNQYSVMVRVL